jgi:hypothetical protein
VYTLTESPAVCPSESDVSTAKRINRFIERPMIVRQRRAHKRRAGGKVARCTGCIVQICPRRKWPFTVRQVPPKHAPTRCHMREFRDYQTHEVLSPLCYSRKMP